MALDQLELFQLATLELANASSPYLSLDFSADHALAFLGMLQLVLRHPDLPPAMHELAKRIAETIEAALGACGPCVRQLCQLGWQPGDDPNLH